MNQPIVSIIIAIYKSERFLNKLITSAINQTYKNIEIILVDDGSPDNSGLICDEFAEKDDRIIVIHKENGGVSDARNAALNICRGEYVVFSDGDDWLASDYVEYLLNLAVSAEADMAMSDSIFTSRNLCQNEIDNIRILTSEEAATFIIYPYMTVGPWNKIYKKTLIDRYNLKFERAMSGEGLHFSSNFAQLSNHVVVGHRNVYYYRLNNTGSALTHYNVQMGINALDSIKYIKENLHINSVSLINAVEWHIWKNYNWCLELIVATNSKEEHIALYTESLQEIRKRLPKVLLHSKLGIKTKAKMLLQGIFPVTMAKIRINKQNTALKNELANMKEE